MYAYNTPKPLISIEITDRPDSSALPPRSRNAAPRYRWRLRAPYAMAKCAQRSARNNGDSDVDGETTTAKRCFSHSFVLQGCRAAVAAGRCCAECHHDHAPGSFARTTLVANAERNTHTDALTRICPRSTGCQPRINDNDNNIAARNPRISPCNHVGLA